MKKPDNQITDLRLADLREMNLRGADLGSAKTSSVSTSLYGANFAGTDLSEADLRGGAEFNRLMTVAIVSQRFRQQLLTKPAEAIAAGYQGEKFNFSPTECQLLLSIKTRSLEEFAEQLRRGLQTEKS